MENQTQMSLPAIVRKALNRPGQFTGFLWNRPCKLRKGVSATITKEVRCVGRLGVDFDQIEKVKQARESGELPSENTGLPWGQWLIFPYLITHNGNLYLRIYPVASRRPKVIYRLNGKVAKKSEVESMCLASEFKEVNEEIGCMTLNVANLRIVR